ncbi:hypothetical protein F4782DRAFT_544286 [Xylaria castorea]|nr:hypothetical protein F4782DRAFT_544286 [Xylaria castorea]
MLISMETEMGQHEESLGSQPTPYHGLSSPALERHEERHEPSQLQNSSCAVNQPTSSEPMFLAELGDSAISGRGFTSSGLTIHDDQNTYQPISTPLSPFNNGVVSNANAVSTMNENSRRSLSSIHTGSVDDPHGFSRPLDINQQDTGLAETAPMSVNEDSLSSHHDTPSPRPESSMPTSSWKSIYLDWKVLLCFSALFGSTLIAIEVVAAISSQGHGLANGQYQLHYLWKYGTAAVFTLYATLWARVEYNAKTIAPWLQLSSGPKDADRTVLLDYISPFPTTTVFQALRYKDFYVMAAVLVTIILRVLIVLSTSLITLVPVRIELHEVPVKLQHTFRTTVLEGWPLPESAFNPPDSVKAQVYMGLINGEHPYPVGLTESLAYQDFTMDLKGAESLTVAVDAFSGMLECKESNHIRLLPGTRITSSSYYSQTVETENCTYFLNFTFPEHSSRTQYYGRVLLSSCDENAMGNDTSFYLPPENKRNFTLQILTMEITHDQEPSISNDTNQSGLITRVMERSCYPSFVIKNVSVARSTGQNDSLSVTKQQPRLLPKTNPWGGFADLEQLLNHNCDHGGCIFERLSGYCESSCDLNATAVSNNGTQDESIVLDGFLALALKKNLEISPASVAEQFFNLTYIDENVDRLFVSYGAYLGYLLFKDQTKGATANATAIVKSDRLLVTPTVAHVMTGLLGLCLILSLVTIALLPKRDILLPRPTTIMDMAVLTQQSQPFMQSLRGLGSSSEKDMQSQIRSRSYKLNLVRAAELESKQVFSIQVDSESSAEHHSSRISGDQKPSKTRHPLVLHPVTRLILALLVVTIIVTLEVTLRRSDYAQGLMDVRSKDYVQYGWMFLPAIILSLISLYYGSVEFQARLLAPYQNLSSGAPSRVTLFLDLRDKLSVTALVTAIRVRQFAVATAILAAFTSSFLTIASASLFSVQEVSADNDPTQLVPQDVLNYTELWTTRSSNSTFLLAADLDYPAFTFQNLVYPSLRWNESMDDTSSNSAHDRYIEANIPAARASLNCTVITRPHLEATLGAFPGNYGEADRHYIHIKFPDTNCTGPEGNFRIQIDESFTARDFYFGIALPGSSLLFLDDFIPDDNIPEDPSNFIGCASYLYAWGKISNWTGNDLSVTGMGCDEQMQEVGTKLTLFGPDLEIRRDHPPQLDNSSAHAVTYAPKGCSDSWMKDCDNALQYLYMDLQDVLTSEALDCFFSALTFPGGLLALDQSLLGNESMAQSVADAVMFQHQVLRGQAFSAAGRTPVNTPDIRSAIVSVSDSSGFSFPANVSDTTHTTSRIIQDALATRILEALLGAVLVLSCLSWIASPNTNILPRNPVSIASVAAWLADGDVIDLLPHNFHEMTKSDGKALFDDKYFYMRMDQQGRLGIRSALATFTKEREPRSLSSADN